MDIVRKLAVALAAMLFGAICQNQSEILKEIFK